MFIKNKFVEEIKHAYLTKKKDMFIS
jgi:hypothetical protein